MDKNMADEDDTLINKLDDDLLRHIIDLLPIKDAFRTSVLSSRWQNLCRSISNISLNYCSEFSNDDNAFAFLDMIDKILIGHDSSDIKTFIVYSNVLVDATHVHRWISQVIKHNVEVLRLVFRLKETCFLPLCLFRSEFLTVLEIDMSDSDSILGSESLLFSVDLPNLKCLELTQIRFLDNHSTQRFFSNIPKLQELYLFSCYWEKVNRLVIDIRTLESVVVRLDGKEGSRILDRQVTVIAPNLTNFNCDTNFPIDFLLSNYSLQLKVFCRAHLYEDDSVEKRLALIRLLESVKKLMTLQVKWKFFRGLNVERIGANHLPVFMNLTDLEILPDHYITSYNVNVKKMFVFLHYLPNLQSLTIFSPREDNVSHLYYNSPSEDVGPSDDVPSCVIYQIKNVSISTYFHTNGCHNNDSTAMGIVDYFMNHSQSLKMLEVNELSKEVCPAWIMDKIKNHPRYSELKDFSCSTRVGSRHQKWSWLYN